MTKHAPGPWEVADDLDIVSTGPKAINVATCGTSIQRFYKTAVANARLIAAAPELLEACKGIESTYVYLDSMTAGTEPQHTNTIKALAVIQAAIAKAEGVTP